MPQPEGPVVQPVARERPAPDQRTAEEHNSTRTSRVAHVKVRKHISQTAISR